MFHLPRKLLGKFLLALLVLGGVMLNASVVHADEDDSLDSLSESLQPQYPHANRGDACVEPTDVMRRSHFKFILHQRDETMHRGIRTRKHSLKNCISCHVSKDDKGAYIPVNEEGQFCESCHEYAAVTIDCFECHATVPTPRKGSKAHSN